MDKPYYVYVLFRQNGEPFYVGMGKGDRWLVHEKRAHFQRSHRDRIIVSVVSSMGDLPKIKVREGLTREEAVETEIALISSIGREPAGPLINQTRGGDGVVDLPEETRRLIGRKVSVRTKGRKQATEHTEKIRAAHIAMKKVITAEQRSAISASLSGRVRPDLSEARRGRPLSEEVKAKLRGRKHSEAARSKISAALRERDRKPETGRKIGDALRGRPKSESHIAKLSLVAGNNTRGKVWITDGERSRRTLPGDALPAGWRMGRALQKAFARG